MSNQQSLAAIHDRLQKLRSEIEAFAEDTDSFLRSPVEHLETVIRLDEERQLYTFAEACQILDIGTTTGYRLLSEGRFPVPIVQVGYRKKVARSAIEAFLNGHTFDHTPASTIGEADPVELLAEIHEIGDLLKSVGTAEFGVAIS